MVRYDGSAFWNDIGPIHYVSGCPMREATNADRTPAECLQVERSHLSCTLGLAKKDILTKRKRHTAVRASMSPKDGTLGVRVVSVAQKRNSHKHRRHLLLSRPTTASSCS